MHASAAALQGRTVCSSHQARTLVSFLGPLWEDQRPLLVVAMEPNWSRDFQAQTKKRSMIDVYKGVF